MLPPVSVLLQWYAQHGRALPWRRTRDPYRIWLAEVILQQTRVQTGWSYYERFLERFPTIQALAEAPEDAVLKAWQGLGYYSRARNLHRAAQVTVNEHAGELPCTAAGLRQLPGVGPYTAHAVASFAFGERVAVVDGNVFRVLSRLTGDETPIDRSGARAHFQGLADQWLAGAPGPAAFNHAVMDFGATHCTPRQPACTGCPFRTQCAAYQSGRVTELPRKAGKPARGLRYVEFYWVEDGRGRIALLQRGTKAGVWRGLWVPPSCELPDFATPPARGKVLGTLKHEFSHYQLRIRLVALTPAEAAGLFGEAAVHWVDVRVAHGYALPRAVERMIELARGPQQELF